jgi:hypothetical protein
MHEAYQPVIDDGRGRFPEDLRVTAPRGARAAIAAAAQLKHTSHSEYVRQALLIGSRWREASAWHGRIDRGGGVMPTNPYAPASVDFSALANLPDQYAAGQQFARQQQLRNAFAGGLPKGPDGTTDWNSATGLLAGSDPSTALQLGAQMAVNQNKHNMVTLAERHNG